MSTPLRRHKALQPFSREHHDGLLLSWKIKQGLKHHVDTVRIKRYTDWFWQVHLKSHFEAEEQYIFPILRDDDELVVQALSEHQQLEELFHLDTPDTDSLILLADLLNHHIRFEERILFAKIQCNLPLASYIQN